MEMKANHISKWKSWKLRKIASLLESGLKLEVCTSPAKVHLCVSARGNLPEGTSAHRCLLLEPSDYLSSLFLLFLWSTSRALCSKHARRLCVLPNAHSKRAASENSVWNISRSSRNVIKNIQKCNPVPIFKPGLESNHFPMEWNFQIWSPNGSA